MVKYLIFLLYWVVFVALKVITLIAGLIMIAPMYFYRKRLFVHLPKLILPWANPEDWFGGPQGTEHSLPQWWIDQPVDGTRVTVDFLGWANFNWLIKKPREHRGAGFRSFYLYHAIRNPANGLRNFESLDLDIDKDKVEYKTPRYLRYYEPWYGRPRDEVPKTYGYIAWQGYMAGVKFVHEWNANRHFVFKFGWRVEPRDSIDGPDPHGQRVKGAGFATKLLPYRKG